MYYYLGGPHLQYSAGQLGVGAKQFVVHHESDIAELIDTHSPGGIVGAGVGGVGGGVIGKNPAPSRTAIKFLGIPLPPKAAFGELHSHQAALT